MLRQCRFYYANCLNKLGLTLVCDFKVDDHEHDEKFRDFDEQPFLVFFFVSCWSYLVGVNVAFDSHEKIPFKLGASKEIWDLSRFRIYEVGIWETDISFVKFMSSLMCQVEVWGVLTTCVKFGVVNISGQLLSLWAWQNHKSRIAKGILGHMWFPSYVWCVMGMEFLIIEFSGLLWTRNKNMASWALERKIGEIWPLETFYHLICCATCKNLCRSFWWC